MTERSLRIRALVKEKPEPGLSLLDIETPQVEHADDVQFKVEYCAICVGETKAYDWNEWAAADPTLNLPTVLGHEVAAVVTEVGQDVKEFKPDQTIRFFANQKEILVIEEDGMIYLGERVHDAGKAHEAFMDTMTRMREAQR